MAKTGKKRGFWRTLRIYFRRFRMVVWSMVLLFLLILLGLNQIGLPDFVKKPLLARLGEEGIHLQFSRLRLRWLEGIVAENVRFGQSSDPAGPNLTSKEVQLALNFRALTGFRIQVDSLRLRDGQLTWPILDTNQPNRVLTLDRIDTFIRLLPEDRWALDNFSAQLAGAQLRLSGTLSNAYAVTNLTRLLAAPETADRPHTKAFQRRLRAFADALESIKFAMPPELRLDLSGDAKDPRSFRAQMVINAPGATTPWGTLEEGRLVAVLHAADSNEVSRAEIRLAANRAHTPWAAVTNFNLTIDLSGQPATNDLIQGTLVVESSATHTEWVDAGQSRLEMQWVHSITNPIPLSGRFSINCEQPVTRWGKALGIHLTANLVTSSHLAFDAPPDLAWWRYLYPYHLDWECQVSNLVAPDLQSDDLTLTGTWRAPELVLTNLHSKLYRGSLLAQARLDVASRRLAASIKSEVDPHKLGPVLGEDARKWLSQFTWQAAPRVQGDIALVLPSWTNRHPDWKTEVLPTLLLAAQADIPSAASFRGIPVLSASTHIEYSNRCWHLTDLRANRPEGFVLAEHRADEKNHDFYWRFQSSVDPSIIRHLLSDDTQQAFDMARFTVPPFLEGEVMGNGQVPESIGFKGHLSLTNFSFRDESVSTLQASLAYTNRLLQVFQLRFSRGTNLATVDGLLADFRQEKIFLTNGFSTVEPMFIARVIGPSVIRAIGPYQFETPPTAKVYGTIPLHGEEGADLHFQVQGTKFNWWKFHLQSLSGDVHWLGKSLTLRNVNAGFYDGQATGYATFRFRDGAGADFDFGASVTNALFQFLMSDFSAHSNSLEGRLSGSVAVTAANTEDWRTVQGYGEARLKEGLIWDFPLFGLFSPVLNGISPGLGQSKATSATTTFSITNGVLLTRDLEVRSPQMRLQYNGSVDLEGTLNAKAEAELLRDVWLVGPLVSTVFWPVTKLFEYRVSGTLSEPKMVPVTPIPRIMQIPLQPFRTLKGLFQDSSQKTNAPPQTK